MKKLFSLLLALTLLLALAAPAAAYSDVTYAQNTTLPGQMGFNFDNVTVKSGVTVTFRDFGADPQTIWVYKTLTVESGGAFAGPGSIAFVGSAAAYTGMDFYYRVQGQEVRLDPANLQTLIADDSENHSIFGYSRATGHFVLTGYDFDADPFAAPLPGGDPSGTDPNAERELAIAEQLKTLGLFIGTGTNDDGSTNFDLDRAPTRVEAVIMLIRLKGLTAEAAAYPAEKCPFTDVDDWAKPYLAYAFDTGLTYGRNPENGVFDPTESDVRQFLTFVLRAMGYEDEVDFTWDRPEALAESLGIVLAPNDVSNFTRGTCVRIMEIALRNATKGGGRLADKLIAQGVFTQEAYDAAFPKQ